VVGEQVDVTIAVIPQMAADSAVVRAVGSEQLHVAASVGAIEIAAPDPAAVYRFAIPVTATADGVQILQLDVALKHDDVTDLRSFSVPLIVATAGAANAGHPDGATAVGAASR
jgi:hypothetical protein